MHGLILKAGFSKAYPQLQLRGCRQRLCHPMTAWRCCSFVNTVLTWLINPIVLGSVILFVGFWLLITRGQLKRYYTESGKLKEEFDKYRREMQVKVALLASLSSP